MDAAAWAGVGTAVATFILAGATWYMAAKTRDAAQATREAVQRSTAAAEETLQVLALGALVGTPNEYLGRTASKALLQELEKKGFSIADVHK